MALPTDAKKVFEGVVYDTYQWEQEQFDGSFKTFEILDRNDTAIVIPVIGEQVVIIREQQPGKDWKVTLPGGAFDDEVEPVDAAKRECLEEIGMRFEEFRLIHDYQVSSRINQHIYTFIANGLVSEQKQDLDRGGERVDVLRVSFDEFFEMIRVGKLDQGAYGEMFPIVLMLLQGKDDEVKSLLRGE